MMDRCLKKGLKISAGMHGLCVLVLILVFVLDGLSSKRQAPSHVFQLEVGPNNKESISKEAVRGGVVVKAIAIPEEVKISKSLPKLVPKPSEKTKPVEKTAVVVQKAQEVQKVQKDEEKKISYAEFVKTQSQPVAKESKAAVAQTVTAPKIQMPDMKKRLEEKLSDKGGALGSVVSGTNGGILGEYQAYVRSIIDASWEQPRDFSGYNNATLIEFDVDKLGSVLNVRIVKSSGSQIFDESVQKAFGRVTSVMPTPDGKMLAGCRLTFAKKER